MRWKCLFIVSLVCFASLSHRVALAHVAPESEFGHHIQLRISAERVIVDYATVLSDLSLAQALLEMETDGVPGISEAERKAYDDQKRKLLLGHMEFLADGEPAPLSDDFEEVPETPERVFVYKFSADVATPEGQERKISFYNTIKLPRDEWLVYYVAPERGIAMIDGNRWQKPEDEGKTTERQGQRGVVLIYQARTTAAASETLDNMLGKVSKTEADTEGDKIKALIQRPLSLQFVVVALVVSAVLGGLHALTPGHGKAVVAAYLVGSRGRVRDAVFLGLVVTFTHTFSVIALGLVTLFASKHVLPQDIAPWLSAASGFLIAVLGTWLLGRNINQYQARKSGYKPEHQHEHDHSHDHDHGHTHEHDYDHDDAHGHTHDHHTHSHGGRTHSHVPDRPGVLGLLSLGISGGIVPCIDALVGLLFAISINRIEWGLVILFAFSVGLAAVLVAIGVLMVLAKPVIDRFSGEGVWLQRLPIFSSVVVIVLGTILMFKALTDIGIITINL